MGQSVVSYPPFFLYINLNIPINLYHYTVKSAAFIKSTIKDLIE